MITQIEVETVELQMIDGLSIQDGSRIEQTW